MEWRRSHLDSVLIRHKIPPNGNDYMKLNNNLISQKSVHSFARDTKLYNRFL